MVSDSKKIQSLINLVGRSILVCRLERDNILAARSLYQLANPVITGTVLDGNIASINTAINSLDTIVDDVAFNLLVNNIIESHRGKAL